MKKTQLTLLSLFLLLSNFYIFSKRLWPEPVNPVYYKDIIIRVNHYKMGFIEVYRNEKLLWDKKIYEVKVL